MLGLGPGLFWGGKEEGWVGGIGLGKGAINFGVRFGPPRKPDWWIFRRVPKSF